MIRVAVFADHDLRHSLAGGANVNLEENLRRLAGRYKIRLLCGWEEGLPDREVASGIEIRRFRGNQASLRWTIPRYFKEKIEDETDIVWDEVDASVPWLTPLFTKKPILMHCLHFQKANFFSELPAWKAAPAYTLEPWLYRLYKNHRTLTISESTKQSLLDIGFSEENIRIVSPGLPQQAFKPEEEILGVKSKTPFIVSLSRLRAWKGVHFAIQAMQEIVKEVPEAKMAVIGTGPYEGELRRLAERLGLTGYVQFLGKLPEKEKMAVLAKATLLTKTSGREGWGIDVLEANACFTPAVGWRVPGTQDSIRDEKTGLLADFGDVSGLARKIVMLLKDPGLRQTMAGEARRFAEGFTWEKSAEATAQVLADLIQKK